MISNPAIDADLNVAKPLASILEEALATVEFAPPINAGVLILSTVISPCTVNVPPANCKKFCPALSPNNISLAVTLPSGVKWNSDELTSILLPEPLINAVSALPTKNVSDFTSNSVPENCRKLVGLSPNNNALAVTLPSGVRWKSEDDISMSPPLPLINCEPVLPTKKASALTSNKLGFVLNLNEPLGPTNSNPTPA